MYIVTHIGDTSAMKVLPSNKGGGTQGPLLERQLLTLLRYYDDVIVLDFLLNEQSLHIAADARRAPRHGMRWPAGRCRVARRCRHRSRDLAAKPLSASRSPRAHRASVRGPAASILSASIGAPAVGSQAREEPRTSWHGHPRSRARRRREYDPPSTYVTAPRCSVNVAARRRSKTRSSELHGRRRRGAPRTSKPRARSSGFRPKD